MKRGKQSPGFLNPVLYFPLVLIKNYKRQGAFKAIVYELSLLQFEEKLQAFAPNVR
mgnify:FL=1